ncbi:MAG: hypothetical protein WCF12_01335 [Propionicimonas sp.]
MNDSHDNAAESPAAMKAAAVFAAVAGLGFGIPGAFGIKHFAQTGEVWTFLGFPTYGKGPFERVGVATSTPLLGAFLGVCTAEVATAWLLWQRPRAGARVSHALLPAEVLFWTGFALPFGPILGLARTLSILSARPRA